MKLPGVILLIAGVTISFGALAQAPAPATGAAHARRPAITFGAPSRTGHRTLGPRHVRIGLRSTEPWSGPAANASPASARDFHTLTPNAGPAPETER